MPVVRGVLYPTTVNRCEVRMDPREGSQREVAQLAGPRMPADRGLASLGLIMQLGGSIFLGYMAMVAVLPIFGGGGFAFFLVGVAGAVRSGFHRSAGHALVYGSPAGVFRPTYTYIGVAVAQTALTLLVLNKDGGIPASLNLTAVLVLLAWPVTLLALLTRPRLRDIAAEPVLPISEDMGFEGSASLMVLLGLIGSLVGVFMLYTGFSWPGGFLGSATGLLLMAVFAMLLARSILHVAAGLKGTRGIDSDGATESAARYYSFGVVSSVIAGGALLILVMMGQGAGAMHPVMLVIVATAVYLLLSWPLILRRFYTERNFSALLAGAEGPNYRRAPDAGMTAVGWLLLALGVLQLSFTLPSALFGQSDLTQALFSFGGLTTDMTEMSGGRSSWWLIGTGMAQVWAGLELIHMTDRHRLAATIYGAVASVVTLYVMWPQLQQIEQLSGPGAMEGFGSVATYFQMAISLVVPIGTIALANRKLMPAARAVVRTSPPSSTGTTGGGGTSIVD
jgi:hypothetical protein